MECISCRRNTAHLQCEICGEAVCKNCEQFLSEGSFSFLQSLPEDLKHTHYCPNCFDAKVAPERERYNEIMERAKNLFFFFTTQKQRIPILKRGREKIKVESCADRDETILRLAFMAAEKGFTAVIEGEVNSEKVRNSGYQRSRWSGVGIPAMVDVDRLERSALYED